MNTINERIKWARERAKISQAALAKRLGISPGAVGKWDMGISKPEIGRVGEIADIVGVPAEWLLRGGDIKTYTIGTSMASPKVFDDISQRLSEIQKQVEVARAAETSPAEEIIRGVVSLMPRFKMDAIPHFGVAAADEQDGRQYDGEADPGTMTSPDALEPRVVTVRGSSAEDFAWDGQQCVIDIGHTNVAIGDLCVILTQDKCLRLKRKSKDRGKLRVYVSINRDFPAFEVPARSVVAEFPVVTVLVKTKTTSPVETFNEGFPV